MTERIVVGIDFSKASIAAAEWAARELSADAELVLTHVITLPRGSPILRSRLPKPELTADTLRVGADMKMRALCSSLQPRRVWPEIVEGDAGAALLEVAEAFDARMIVLGRRGTGSSIDTGVGSTASGLVMHCPVPLLILSSTLPTRPFHVLAPVDRRESAERAASESRGLLGDRTSRLTLLHVIPGNVMKHFQEQGNWDDETYVGEFEWVDRWCRLAREAGWPASAVRTEEVFGNPGSEIRAAVERLRADVLVMPRRSGASMRRALLGSVTESIVRDPPCAILVLPDAVARDRKAPHWRSAPRATPLAFPALIP